MAKEKPLDMYYLTLVDLDNQAYKKLIPFPSDYPQQNCFLRFFNTYANETRMVPFEYDGLLYFFDTKTLSFGQTPRSSWPFQSSYAYYPEAGRLDLSTRQDIISVELEAPDQAKRHCIGDAQLSLLIKTFAIQNQKFLYHSPECLFTISDSSFLCRFKDGDILECLSWTSSSDVIPAANFVNCVFPHEHSYPWELRYNPEVVCITENKLAFIREGEFIRYVLSEEYEEKFCVPTYYGSMITVDTQGNMLLNDAGVLKVLDIISESVQTIGSGYEVCGTFNKGYVFLYNTSRPAGHYLFDANMNRWSYINAPIAASSNRDTPSDRGVAGYEAFTKARGMIVPNTYDVLGMYLYEHDLLLVRHGMGWYLAKPNPWANSPQEARKAAYLPEVD